MEASKLLETIRKTKPLIHHITNWVTIYDCANVVKMVGALPVMAHAKEEVEEMVSISSALILNIGTLTPELVESMILAGKKANEKGIPVILDAVGVGATSLRIEKTKEIMQNVKVDIIKGNSSEIATLAGAKAETKGVEAISVEGDLQKIAENFAKENGLTVVITGKHDIIAGNDGINIVNNGHEMMGSIVGTGCMAASVIGSFAAVEKNYLEAATAAMICYGIAGELAARTASGPGTFKGQLFNELYELDEKTITNMQNVEIKKYEME